MPDQLRDIDRLMDIAEFAALVKKHTENITIDNFHKSDILKWAVLKYLENIGEAVRQLSPNTKEEFDGLDWQLIIKARNFHVHEYFAIDWPLIWETVNTVDFIFISNYTMHIADVLKKRYSL